MIQIPSVKARQVISVLKRLGFRKHHQVGSHAQFKHFDGRRTTVPVHGGKDIGKKTLKSIINDSGLTKEEFLAVLKKKSVSNDLIR